MCMHILYQWAVIIYLETYQQQESVQGGEYAAGKHYAVWIACQYHG